MIHETAVIGRDVVFVDRSSVEIGPFVSLEGAVTVGRRVRISAGARIGQDGFGYEAGPIGWVEKPQRFGIVLHDDVHVGANACIDRGSWRDTVIGVGSKIDNLVHVAHNVVVGARCLIVAQSELSGSVDVGDDAYVAPGALVREHLVVGARSVIGLGAVVVKDVPEDVTVAGVPARVTGPANGPPAPPMRKDPEQVEVHAGA